MERRCLLSWRSVVAAIAIGSVCAAPASAAGAARSLTVRAPVVVGFTDVHGSDFEATALVEGRPFRKGAMELRGSSENGVMSGRFRIFDGRGGLRGHLRAATMDGSHFDGTFTLDGGAGRYRRAAGVLRFSGVFDSQSVPAVTVLPGTLRGDIEVEPAAPRPRFSKPRRVQAEGKGAKARFRQLSTDPFVANLTSAFATATDRFGNGVWIETDRVRLDTRLRPKVLTWYGADGTWTAKGTTSLDTGPNASDPMKVTGGTGRYRGARGRVRYTIVTPPAVSGLQIARVRGKLRFP